LNNSVSNFTVNDVSASHQSIYRARKSSFSINPTSLNEIHSSLDKTDTITSNGEEFLLINEQKTNIIIFPCETN
jgi:hypothetical protein